MINNDKKIKEKEKIFTESKKWENERERKRNE